MPRLGGMDLRMDARLTVTMQHAHLPVRLPPKRVRGQTRDWRQAEVAMHRFDLRGKETVGQLKDGIESEYELEVRGPCNIRREGRAIPCNIRRSLVILEGREGIPL